MGLLDTQKTQSNSTGREKREQGRHLAPAPALFVLFISTRQTANGGENKPIQARNGDDIDKYTKHTRKAPQNANNKPTRATKGDTMTAGEWETLKQAQRQATKGGNLAELNRTNKTLFEERERRQKTREQAREQEREKCFLLKYPLSAKKCFLPFLQQLQIYI